MTYRDVQFFGLGMVVATAFALATQLLLIQQQVTPRVVVLLLVVLLGIALAVVGGMLRW
jgi:hypothetical protein